MPAQEKPSVLVPETYKPSGIRHPVKTGESWISLAKAAGIDPWDLIDLNFPGMKKVSQVDRQRATRQVNWYLSEYVGCQTPAPPDNQNWAFSSGLTKGKGVWKGGVIFLPPGPPPPPPPTPKLPEPPPAPPKLTPPACEMSRPEFYRLLNEKEKNLAIEVFGRTLPPWEEIGIGNGLGAGGRPWTSDGFYISGVGYPQTPDVKYALNLGNVAHLDLTLTGPTYGWLCDDFGRICDLFIHEMTHVWQMFNQSSAVMVRSAWAQEFGAGYEYRPGDSWDSYNVEQQAHIVEDWNHYKKISPLLAEDRYPYVRLVVRSGRLDYPRGLTLEELKKDLQSLRDRHLD